MAAPRFAPCCARPTGGDPARRSRRFSCSTSASPQAQNLIHEVYQNNLQPAAIGALARCVQTAFSEGDEAASGILRGAADELESSGVSVAKRLGMGAESFPFILAGGIFRAVPWLRDEMQRRLPLAVPNSTARLLDREPAAGAVSFAIQEAKGGARIPRYVSE